MLHCFVVKMQHVKGTSDYKNKGNTSVFFADIFKGFSTNFELSCRNFIIFERGYTKKSIVYVNENK